jgi:hypothetical protein
MSDDDIDLERIIDDPAYRRRVIEYLNIRGDTAADNAVQHPRPGSESRAAHDRGNRTLG